MLRGEGRPEQVSSAAVREWAAVGSALRQRQGKCGKRPPGPPPLGWPAPTARVRARWPTQWQSDEANDHWPSSNNDQRRRPPGSLHSLLEIIQKSLRINSKALYYKRPYEACI